MDPVRFRKSQYFLLPESFQNLLNVSLHCCTVKCRDYSQAKIVQTLLSLSGFIFVLECLQSQSRPTLCIYSGKHGTPFMATSVTWGLFKLRFR